MRYLTCLECADGGEYSANPADYFMVGWRGEGDPPMTCSQCGEPMALVESVVSIRVLANRVTVATLETFEAQERASLVNRAFWPCRVCGNNAGIGYTVCQDCQKEAQHVTR